MARMTSFDPQPQAHVRNRIEANWIIARTFSSSLWERVATRRTCFSLEKDALDPVALAV
jgi:hypothetical protein